MNKLKDFLMELGSLSFEEWEMLASMGERLQMKKAQTFLFSMQYTLHEVFLLKGTVRAYLIDETGNDKTTAFYQEGAFVSTHTFRTLNGNSIANYETLEDCELVFFKSTDLKSFFAQSPLLQQLGYTLKELEKKRLARRDETLLPQGNMEKYKKFQEYYPNLEHKISHKYISSYLGMTPVSLSRLRRSIRIADKSVNN
ncbi:MAG: Crp/Fnr family transcriptional regulator [Sporocytophaga sp.]|uniref:Crp/Fnr family transcriptional regulator n=1 Tax=Sporocytophaga sp. TaxID=2231183 RepID=UPI001B088236|nr:Crp/Fnr family transcriptional regulator [Sporocytophaga sp.]MBO9699986.1 Crp/Fnr family transcriptional regulator [Sporocytophaga sp.]